MQVKDTPCKRLDLKKLVSLLLQPHHQIVEIKYFTANVSGRFDSQGPETSVKFYLDFFSYPVPELKSYTNTARNSF